MGEGPRAKAPPGCYWRGETLWARFKVAGVEHRQSLRTGNRAEAAKRRDALKKQAEEAAYYGGERRSWQSAVVAWADWIGTHVAAGTVKRYKASLRMVDPHLAPLDLHEIDRVKLLDIIASRRDDGATNATIRRDLSAVSSVLGYAEEQGWIEQNAAALFNRKRLKERREPITLPSEVDLAAVLAKLPPMLARMARFARATGMRSGEIAGLTVQAIDKRRRTAQLGKTKRGAGRAVWLSDEAMAEIEGAALNRPKGCAFVFWHGEGEPFRNLPSNFRRVVRGVARRAAQEKRPFREFRFHDLRHLYIVEQLRAGRSIAWLKDQVGHSTTDQTDAYARVFLSADEADAARGRGTRSGTGAAVSEGDGEKSEADQGGPVAQQDRAAVS